MQRLWVTLFVLVAAALVSSRGSGDDQPKDRNVFMKMKLQNAQAVLEGLALNDFKRIEQSAEYLWMLSKKAEFQHRHTPEYKQYSDAFGRNAETIVRMAQEKNLDGAARAYVQMTINCVDCHKHLREAKDAK
jgi:cytochrome c556